MANVFNKIKVTRPGSSRFDLSYDHKLSFKMGKLIPVNVIEALPGDKFRISSEGMFRLNPMIAPIMHKVDIYMHHFFVPNRLVWDGWEAFITGAQNDTQQPAFPTMALGALSPVLPSTLADYMGLPLGNFFGSGESISALPFAAYQRIWFDYYRDQNLQQPNNLYDFEKLPNGSLDVSQTGAILELQSRAWEHDYFTSALPFAQKGDAVDLPLDLSGDVSIAIDPSVDTYGKILNTNGTEPPAAQVLGHEGTAQDAALISNPTGSSVEVKYDPNGTLKGEFEEVVTSTTINDLRTAFSLQKWLEKNARGGSRYNESILAHFGVRSSDYRLQRAEYIGGVKASMAISEVLQTSESGSTPQGTMAGHGVAVAGGRNAFYRCEEHGYFMTILSVRPKTAYMQGLPKHFSKIDRLQYYWPDFAFLGEEPILNKELYFDFTTPANNNQTFGYIPRYSEYRYMPSRVSGIMRTDLDFWHMARKFTALPDLNADFIKCDPTTRIFAVEEEDADQIVAHIYHKIMATRPLPLYGNPGSI